MLVNGFSVNLYWIADSLECIQTIDCVCVNLCIHTHTTREREHTKNNLKFLMKSPSRF